jgi:hypothetical protein
VTESAFLARSEQLRAGHDVPGRQCNKSAGAPSPRISCKLGGFNEASCGFPYRKPHTLPWLGPRNRKSGVLRAFCEGWDTTNLDTDGRVSVCSPDKPCSQERDCLFRTAARLAFSGFKRSFSELPGTSRVMASWLGSRQWPGVGSRRLAFSLPGKHRASRTAPLLVHFVARGFPSLPVATHS